MGKNSFMNQDTKITNRGIATVVNNQGLIVPLTEGTISADTYLENCFYSRCACNSRKINIFYEWQSNKRKYINRTELIPQDYPHYSNHNEEHSRAIIEAIEMFLGKWRVDRMSIGDMWLLLNAAYGHDIGMIYGHDEAKELWTNSKDFRKYLENVAGNTDDDMYDVVSYCKQLDNVLKNKEKMSGIETKADGSGEITALTSDWPVEVKKNALLITSDYIRRHHHERSQSFFERLSKILETEITENRLYKLLGKVVYAHGADMSYIEKELPIETQGFGNETMHPQFIAMLLRLGDLLDMDNNRFDIVSLEHFGAIPHVSESQLNKHLALTHLLITDKEIQATEHTDDYDVCRVAKRWFQFIEEETKNITSSWNKIAPENFGGCTFKGCDLKIYLNGSESESFENNYFQVENKKFMSVLIGDKLYSNILIFFREYLQNAIDATKLAIWIKNKNEEEEVLREYNNYKSRELTPRSLNSVALKNYGIEIKIELAENENEEKVYIHILDHGIGMDEECLRALSIIGTGWNGRKKYMDDIAEMPAWMKPAGGFGIGIQSGFMITDKIHIITRGMRDSRGYDIELFSPRKSGKINYLYTKSEKIGTEVILEVPFAKLLKHVYDLVDMKKIHGQNNEVIRKTPNCFSYEELLQDLQNAIAEYVNEVVPNSSIPIFVTRTTTQKNKFIRKKVNSIMERFNETSDGEITEENGIDYVEDNKDPNKSYYWMRKEQIFVCLKSSFINNEDRGAQKDKLLFKGTYVEDTKEYILSKYITVVVDVMGKGAQEVLVISRSSFRENSRKELQKMVVNCLKLHVNMITERIKKDIKEKGKAVITANEYGYWFVNNLYFEETPKLEWLKAGTLVFNSASIYVQRIVLERQRYYLRTEAAPLEHLLKLVAEKEEWIMWISAVDEEEFYFDTTNIAEETEKTGEKNSIRSKLEQVIKNMTSGDKTQLFIRDETLVTILEEYVKEKNYKVIRVRINGLNGAREDCNVAILEVPKAEETEDEKMNVILQREIKEQKMFVKVGKAYRKDFGNLFVTATPYYDISVEEDENVILVPFSRVFYDKGILEESNSVPNVRSVDEFLEKITSQKEWKRAVNWVNCHSKYKGGLSNKEKIEEQYRDFCGRFYDVLEMERKNNVMWRNTHNNL